MQGTKQLLEGLIELCVHCRKESESSIALLTDDPSALTDEQINTIFAHLLVLHEEHDV